MERQPLDRCLRLIRMPVDVLAWLVRRALDHPHVIVRPDASAATLWPDHAVKDQPWRLR
jgi:hypothetical protein